MVFPQHFLLSAVAAFFVISADVQGFAPAAPARTANSLHQTHRAPSALSFPALRMSETDEAPAAVDEVVEEIDPATLLQLEKQRRADELRSQEVFMKRSTGKHKCSNCDWEYSPEKGDSFLIGGMIQPGTDFADLPTNWRCPTCRASKDNFNEVVEEIPGFEVNQGYGFGTNSMTSGEKSALIWGGLGVFLLLFLGGYALS